MERSHLWQIVLCLPLCAVLSCYDEDESNLMVYSEACISEDELVKYKKEIAEAERLIISHEAEVEAFFSQDKSNPATLGLNPDYFEETQSGWVGVVDLGLSHKWACVNVGGEMLSNEVNRVPNTFKEFLGVDVKPDLDNVLTGIPYLDYKGMGAVPDSRAEIEAYISNAKKYAYEYEDYASAYASSQAYKYSFLAKNYGGYVLYGSPHLGSVIRPTYRPPVLSYGSDAATEQWGDQWQTPSDQDLEELLTYCTWVPCPINGRAGALVIGPSKKSIWLPFIGAASPNGRVVHTDKGFYMSNCRGESSDSVWVLSSSDETALIRLQPADYGFSVRPVHK